MILAACLLAAVLGGCGIGPGESEGPAELLVTRDYGNTELASTKIDDVTESTTVMRALDANADIETRYGGGFVSSVDGLANGIEDGRSLDWFYFVNGVAGNRGAAEYQLDAGEQAWWDYRDWTSAMEAQAVVGAFPKPLVGGFEGSDPGVSLDCLDGGETCDAVQTRLEDLGADVVKGSDPDRIRVLVGPWESVSRVPEAARLGKGPQDSGVFAKFKKGGSGFSLLGLDDHAEVVKDFGPQAGLIAATRQGGGMPVWVITAGSKAGLPAIVPAMTPELLAHHYAAVVFDGRIASVPLPGDGS